MKYSRLSMQAQKLIASVLHLIFLTVMFAGIGTMYLNDNFGVGITRVQNMAYEDTDEFTRQFNRDLNDIFQYIEYNSTFESGGAIDVSKEMLQMTFGPNETESFSLADIISYLQSMGYQMNEDFQCTKVSTPAIDARTREGYIDWAASEPEKHYSYLIPGTRRASLEEVSLEIMEMLHQYYSTYNRLLVNPSNLHFKVEYYDDESSTKRATVYANDRDLTSDTLKTYGKYAYLPGNSVFYDTNLKSIALNTVSALAANNPYNTNTFYLLAGVDTTYPVQDVYSNNRDAFRSMQHYYISGFVLLVTGGMIALLTLLFLLKVSGHKNAGDKTITLHGFDRTSTETGIVMFSLLTIAGFAFCRLALVRIAHLVLPEESWALSERVLYTAVFYLGALLLFFSLLRRYKAGTIWTGSFIYRWSERMSIFFTGQSFTSRMVVSFLAYAAINTSLISLAWFLWDRIYLSKTAIYLLTGMVILACVAFNLWIFYLLFKHAVEHDMISTAIERLAAGETSYQVNLDDFDGREFELAANINNISLGLESALQEKVKSERLKTDLITNVSHDIKTPLTSIINYVGLIRRENIQDEKILRYLDVLEQKSNRLKTLTEDLVEASKASSGNLKLEISDIDFIELVYQTNGEFEEKFASRHLELITTAPEETLLIEADGRRLWRVLENLYNNAFKYAMENSRIYIDITKDNLRINEEGLILPPQVVFTIKNISANPLNIRGDELTERFVRGDVARATEGSGLGLSIAKSLTELQKGSFEIYIDGDLFKVQLAFDVKEKPKPIKPAKTPVASADTVKTSAPAVEISSVPAESSSEDRS
ncbi:sensor histidine kinase [Clostridium transplantifaecale]|uniref:sensor histidine kinase n=1 Tax=Clostridium transplantifaecale TaxID=2479838 RepID=UPI000F6398F0|nr:HAMP domain-containing sensor histidine kinase [Clostridium transplantifaecale]